MNRVTLTFSGWLHGFVSPRVLFTVRCHNQKTSVAIVLTGCRVTIFFHICKSSNMHACYFSMYKPQCHSPMVWLPNLLVGNHTNTVFTHQLKKPTLHALKYTHNRWTEPPTTRVTVLHITDHLVSSTITTVKTLWAWHPWSAETCSRKFCTSIMNIFH